MLRIKLYLLLIGYLHSCTEVIGQHLQEVKRRLFSSYKKRRGRQAARLEVGGVLSQDCTTWIRHCSTCLLISSSLPAKGALHRGHTWPPSSGFLLFIFPIRAGKAQAGQREGQKDTFNVNLVFKVDILVHSFG